MPPRKNPNKPLKREHERLIQAWLDTTNPEDMEAIQIFDYWKDLGYSPTQILSQSLRGTKPEDWAQMAERFPSGSKVEEAAERAADRVSEKMYGMLQQLVDMFQSGQIAALTRQGQASMTQFVEDVQEFDEIGLSIADRYRSVSFEDEE